MDDRSCWNCKRPDKKWIRVAIIRTYGLCYAAGDGFWRNKHGTEIGPDRGDLMHRKWDRKGNEIDPDIIKIKSKTEYSQIFATKIGEQMLDLCPDCRALALQEYAESHKKPDETGALFDNLAEIEERGRQTKESKKKRAVDDRRGIEHFTD